MRMVDKSTGLHKPAGHSPLGKFEKPETAGMWGLGAFLCTSDRLRKGCRSHRTNSTILDDCNM